MKKGKAAVIVGAQWGDEGKGKIVDVLSEGFPVVARYAGGHNAGHTVIIRGKKFVLQLVPCGVLRAGCASVIGNGVVLDPIAFLKEVSGLRDMGVPVDGNLFVSNRAQVILPYHRMIELAAENAPGRVKIGTTSRGIGPAYEDKMGRRGLRVADLLDLKLLRTHIENAVRDFGILEIVSVRVFDMYKSKEMPEGFHSLAFRVIYRGEGRTLTDEEVARMHARVRALLEDRFSAQLR